MKKDLLEPEANSPDNANRLPSWSRRLLALSKVVAGVGVAQMGVQLIGMVTSILIIRMLPPEKYALYTLAYALLGTMTVLADSGIGAGVMAEGGKVWRDRRRLGAVIATGLALRKQFAVVAAVVGFPILGYLLWHHGATAGELGLLLLAVAPLFYISLSQSLLQVAPKLHQRLTTLQGVSLAESGLRLVLVTASLFVLPYAAAVMAMTAVATGLGNWRLRLATDQLAERKQPEDPKVRREILALVKRIMPQAIYTSLAGSLTIWLISIFGTTTGVAEVGALNRLQRILGVVAMVLLTVAVPRFARLPERRNLLLSRFLLLEGFLIVVAVTVVGAIWFFPDTLLSLLGENYAHLEEEVRLLAIGIAVGLVGRVTRQMGSARGIVFPPVVGISLSVFSRVVAIVAFDMSTVRGVLLVGVIGAVQSASLAFGYVLFQLTRRKVAA